MKKRILIAAFTAAAMTVAALSGCSNSAKPAETSAQAETADKADANDTETKDAESKEQASDAAKDEKKDLREVNVVLDWYPNAIHTFLYTAIERGYYEEEGLDVQIRFPANANDALSMVAAGKAEIGMYYQQDLIQAVANQKASIRSIGAIVQSPLNIILSLKDKNITSPKDMVGKTIGYGGTVLSESLVKCMMEYVGADASDVNLVDVGFDLMSSMTTGNVDATIGCLVNHEVPQMEEEGFELNYFPVSGYGIPNYYEEVFLTNNKLLEEEPEVVEGFLRASKKGFDDFKADPDGCLAILMNNQNEANFPLTQSVEEQSCKTLLPLMETDSAEFLSQTEECWQENIDWMLENGLIDKAVDVSDVMTNIEY
ncbi:ABC transporter substrate-binding protein [Clostridium sp. OF09-36]|jgi:putative hydroxymethylpyrimidine transport system substrate-binding protein|uniref:ABC transporter substrate-binding protein n=1 Tax=Clostridium sp. OF09-36 TaxID=2292310 RepID=UPI001FA9B5D2|nr:ABC transporter substrate-binding protein [Clostridium sp. OF09-36]